MKLSKLARAAAVSGLRSLDCKQKYLFFRKNVRLIAALVHIFTVASSEIFPFLPRGRQDLRPAVRRGSNEIIPRPRNQLVWAGDFSVSICHILAQSKILMRENKPSFVQPDFGFLIQN